MQSDEKLAKLNDKAHSVLAAKAEMDEANDVFKTAKKKYVELLEDLPDAVVEVTERNLFDGIGEKE